MQNLKNKKGITLIALVVTIIVLLILAGIAIVMVTGDNGLLRKAVDAKQKSAEAEQNDVNDLNEIDRRISAALGKDTTINTTWQDSEGHTITTPITVLSSLTISDKNDEKSLENGIVFKDNKGNEYVWIPVFEKTEATPWGVEWPSGLPAKTAKNEEFTTTHINKIKTAISNYKSGYNNSDSYFNGNAGFENSTQYENFRNKMYISIYKNGGFYLGRYELGTKVVNSVAEAASATRTSNTSSNRSACHKAKCCSI